ncbi:helix-turn-helix domain-containing protein [Hydrocarboniphaga effusa]
MKMATLEGDATIVAGARAKTLLPHQEPSAAQTPPGALGKLVQLMRRDRHLSIAVLAEKADVELSDLQGIEHNPLHKAEPRTIYQLADFFGMPKKKLLQLSGLTAANDSHLVSEALRFAASSDPSAELSHDERAALQAFIAVLLEKK